MPWLSVSELTASSIEAWVEQEGDMSLNTPQHGGTKLVFFLILFALCTMEVVMLKIITTEMQMGRSSLRPATSWFDFDEDR